MALLDGLQKLGKKLKQSKLPDLAGVILGETPVGKVGRIIKRASEILGTPEDPEAIADALATATPEQRQALLELQVRETEALAGVATNEADNLTARHAADMASQSWLSINIRPIVTVVLLGFFLVYVMACVVIGTVCYSRCAELDRELAGFLEHLGMQIVALLSVAISFYFGARAVENIRMGKPRDRVDRIRRN